MATAIFQLCPVWNSEGENVFHFLDFVGDASEFESVLMVTPIKSTWIAPKVWIAEPGQNADVYFGIGNHFFFSDRAQDVIAPLVDEAAEWLAVDSDDLGRLHLLHPLQQVSLGPGSTFQLNPVSGNITVIDSITFDPAQVRRLPAFYVSQAPDSAAARAGLCFPAVMISEAVLTAMVTSGLKGVQGALRSRLDV